MTQRLKVLILNNEQLIAKARREFIRDPHQYTADELAIAWEIYDRLVDKRMEIQR